jgi:hypothetical protein
MTNPWVIHVRKYQKDHNISYKEALVEAKRTYTRKTTTKKKPIKGKGFLERRKPGLFPPKSRRLIAEVGDEKITSLRVERKPILGWLNIATFGQYKKILKKIGYDRMYHLSLIINEKYLLDKRDVLNFQMYRPSKKKNIQILDVPIPPEYDSSINDLINITRDFMGPERFSNYDVQNENCQVFISAVLEANNLLTPELKDFIEQDVESVLKKFPGAYSVISKITDLAGRINRLVEGEGRKKKQKISGKGKDTFYPKEPLGLILKFSSSEMSPLKNIYYSTGTYNGWKVAQVQTYYDENIAIGSLGKLGWKQCPRCKALGYHRYDVEAITIYYDPKTEQPRYATFSTHDLKTHKTYPYEDLEKENGFLVVYVARGSHANYPTKGIKKRIAGLANDITDDDGEILQYRWDQMEPAIDKNFPRCCQLYKGLRPQAPSVPVLE